MGNGPKCKKERKDQGKVPKNKCRMYYENERRLTAAIVFSVVLGIAGIVCGLVWSLGLALVSCVGLLVVLASFRALARRWNAWRYLIHPRNRAEVEQLERSLAFLGQLRKKIMGGDDCTAIKTSLQHLRSRKLVEFAEEKRTTTSIYSDRMSELNAHLNALDSIIVGMGAPENLYFHEAVDKYENFVLEKIRILAYPYLQDMPNV